MASGSRPVQILSIIGPETKSKKSEQFLHTSILFLKFWLSKLLFRDEICDKVN